MQKCLILVGYGTNDEGFVQKDPEHELWEEGFYLGIGQMFKFYDNSVIPYSVLIVAHKDTGEVRPMPVDCVKLIFDNE